MEECLVLRLLQQDSSGGAFKGRAMSFCTDFQDSSPGTAVAQAVDGASMSMGVYSEQSPRMSTNSDPHTHIYVLLHAR